MRVLVRVLPTVCAILVAAASFALSYVALRDVAARTNAVPETMAWLTPICVDGAVLAASASLWASSMRRKRKDPVAVLTVVSLLIISVVINVNHAGPDILAKIIAALPPITLLACLELVAGQYRRDAEDEAAEAAKLEAEAAAAAKAEAATEATRAAEAVAARNTAVEAPTATRPLPTPAAAPTPAAPSRAPQVTAAPAPTTPRTAPVAAPTPLAAAPQLAPQLAPQPAAPQPATAAQPARATAAALAPVPASTTASASATRPAASPNVAPAPAKATPPAQEQRPARPAPAKVDPAEASGAEKIRKLFQEHLDNGGSATDPTLARNFAAELDLQQAYVRKVLGPLRRELAPA